MNAAVGLRHGPGRPAASCSLLQPLPGWPAEGYCTFLAPTRPDMAGQLYGISAALDWIYEWGAVPEEQGAPLGPHLPGHGTCQPG